MFSINKEISKQALLNQLNEVNFTRLPIWDKNPENIVGIILVKDLLKMIIKSKKVEIEKIIHKPVFIPETTNLLHQLNFFKESREGASIYDKNLL